MAINSEKIIENVERELSSTTDPQALQQLKIKFLGKKGEITAESKNIGNLPPDERRKQGQIINHLKSTISTMIDNKIEDLSENDEQDSLSSAEMKMPGRNHRIGKVHPLITVRNEITEKFNKMGFITVEGPEIETEHYNFEALNIPSHHPARDSQDSFYIEDSYLLRTQTSPVQPRIMEKVKPPIAIVCPGRVFRRDTVDASHSPIFHQVEGLYVDKNVTMADLKGLLHNFCKSMFDPTVKIRFRPDYFPFTEPSAEISISCPICKGEGCPTCGGDGWLEILGAGLVNPKVLKDSNIDPTQYSGLAFGMGIERIAMIKYGVNDIRLFYENNYKFLNQF